MPEHKFPCLVAGIAQDNYCQFVLRNHDWMHA